MALYQFGDDVGDIDWKASASNAIPVIRRFVRDSNLAMVLALDTGRNMATTAPDGRPKSEIAMFAAEVVCFLARARGDTVAMVAGDTDRIQQIPARGGNSHMEMLLRRQNHTVASASTAQEALDLAAQEKFDVVLSDLGLPDMSGIDLMRMLRDRFGLRGVALTGFGMEEDVARSREAGFTHHITKPLRLDQLRRVLRDFSPPSSNDNGNGAHCANGSKGVSGHARQ